MGQECPGPPPTRPWPKRCTSQKPALAAICWYGGGMDRPTLQLRLKEAESLVQRMEENIVFQRQMIAALDRGGHDVKAAKMFLRRLEATQAKHLADRDGLFKDLADPIGHQHD